VDRTLAVAAYLNAREKKSTSTTLYETIGSVNKSTKASVQRSCTMCSPRKIFTVPVPI
jgi:hypothetical protein